MTHRYTFQEAIDKGWVYRNQEDQAISEHKKPDPPSGEASDIAQLCGTMYNLGWRPVHHTEGRSYIEIVTNPESDSPKRERWVKT